MQVYIYACLFVRLGGPLLYGNTNAAHCEKAICFHKAMKKEPCFIGGRTFQVESVGRDFFFLNFCFLSGGKMTPLKTQKRPKKIWCFLRKSVEKYSQLFSKFFRQISLDFGQKQLILHDFNKLKNNLPK